MYTEIEALTLTTLQTVTGFSSTNTSRGKWGVLNTGKSDHYAVLKPGTFERQQIAMTANETVFQVIIQVWQRYKDDGDSMTNLEGRVKNILNAVDAKRKIGDTTGTVIESFINAGREMQEQWNKDGALVWLKQDLILEVQEHDTVTYSE